METADKSKEKNSSTIPQLNEKSQEIDQNKMEETPNTFYKKETSLHQSEDCSSEYINIDINELEKYCRVCMSLAELTSLHKSKNYATFVFLSQTCHKSEIVDNLYPSNICICCSSELETVSRFISKLKRTTEQLNSAFSEQTQNEDDDQTIETSENELILSVTDDEDNDCSMVYDIVEETIIIEEDINEDLQEQKVDSAECSQAFKGFKCNICNRLFNYFTSWQCHMMRHDEINKSKCPYCDCISIDKKQYKEHIKTTHKKEANIILGQELTSKIKAKGTANLTVEGNFKCNNCGITFKKSLDLIKHLPSHMENNSEQCTLCDKTFVDKFGLQLHLQTVHPYESKKDENKTRPSTKEDTEEYTCEFCEKQFMFKSNLNRHIQVVHHQNKRFCCEICGEKFTVKNSLKYHLNIHSNSKPYSCDLCSKSFRQPAALFRHKNTKHNNDKKFSCKICFKRFKTDKGIKNHSKRHALGVI